MDQEDFEEMASIGERPVSSLRPIFIPGAADAGHDSSLSDKLFFDDRTGRIFTTPNAAGTDVYELIHPGNNNDNSGADSMSGLPSPSTPPTLSGQGYQTDA